MMKAVHRAWQPLVLLLLLAGTGRASAAEPTPSTSTPGAGAGAGAGGGAGGRDIEDVELDRLLDVKLEEKLGTTAAVSRRTESVLRAPATMTTIDADRIRLSGATTVVEALQWVPGVQVLRNAPGNWVVSLRGVGGLAGNDLVVLIDGMQMNSPLDGSVQWDLLPVSIADIERIEVVRGPVSPIYGPNAYTGVVNIVTRTTGFASSSVNIRSLAGVDDRKNGVGSASGRIAHTGKKLQATWYWSSRYDKTNSTPSGTGPDWAAMGTAGRLRYEVAPATHVSVEVALSRSRRSELDHLVPTNALQLRSQLLALAKIEHTGFWDGRISVDAWARTNVQRVDADQSRAFRGSFSYADTNAMRSEGGSDVSLRLTGFTATAGASMTGEHVNARYIHPSANDRLRFGYGFHGSATAMPHKSLDISVAARGDVPPTLGRFAGAYRASAVLHGESTALRISAGSSYRAPSWVETAGRFVGNGLILLEGIPTLAPPRNDALEIGLVWGPSVDLQIKPTIYASRLSNVMVQDFTPLVRKTFKNDPFDRYVLGGELEANWRVRENILLEAWGGVLGFPDGPTQIATVGVPSQNSTLTGGLHIHGTTLHERVGFGGGVRTFSARSYDVRAGIPPQIRSLDVPDAVSVEGMSEVRVLKSEPLWTSVRVQSSLPHRLIESPLPAASALGTVVLFGLEYRRE
jgi:outer membrane cobalamin receptor